MTNGGPKHQALADRFYNRPFKEHDLTSAEINTLLWTIVEFVGTIKDLMTTLEEAAKLIEVDKPRLACEPGSVRRAVSRLVDATVGVIDWHSNVADKAEP